MNQLPLLTSDCRSCRHFVLEGRRGGTCQKLDVPVQASWKSCSLAVHVFSSSWDQVKKLDIWETATLPEVVLATEVTRISAPETYVLERVAV